MVRGLKTFQDYFKDYTDSYVLIGGAACDILFEQNAVSFRATRDLDMVLMVESLTPDFTEVFWQFVKEAGYQHISGNSGKTQFYRFDKPQKDEFPKMIELFSRAEFSLKELNGLTPIHVTDDISSLSAILLDEDYYQLLLDGRIVENGLSVLKPEYLILFKAKAYMDLSKRIADGEPIDRLSARKHKNDILRITAELVLHPIDHAPASVADDVDKFMNTLSQEPFDANLLKGYRLKSPEVVDRLRAIFGNIL